MRDAGGLLGGAGLQVYRKQTSMGSIAQGEQSWVPWAPPRFFLR